MTPYVNDSQPGRSAAAVALAVDEAEVGQFFSPSSRRYRVDDGPPFIVDNGCFGVYRPGDKIGTFPYMIERLKPHRDRCRFVAVPDVFGSGIETRALWDDRKTLFPFLAGWPLAFVAQHGSEGLVPWGQIAALFVGGRDSWQMSRSCASLVRAAKIRGLWVHVGRVNTRERLKHFQDLGADSFDGLSLTGRARPEQAKALSSLLTAEPARAA